MAFDGSVLCNVGVSYPLASEIGRQITAGIGKAHLLCELGLNAGPAKELARQINAGVYSDDLLCRAMWNPVTAVAVAAVGNGGSGFTQTVFLTTPGTGNWSVPADFASLVSVETIPAGGGCTGSSAGAGGGSYSASPGSALAALTASWLAGTTMVPYVVGAGASAANGQETVFGATSLAAAVTLGPALAVAADPGKTNVTTTGGIGGLASNSVGTTKFNGGSGGNSSQTNGAGGGAAGPFGAGGAGGAGNLNTLGAPGGGGGGGGAAGAAGITTSGGVGGNNWLGFGPGSVTASSPNASLWGAGGDGCGTTTGVGAAGANGIEWDRTHGSGGGGGSNVASSTATNAGGLYGGGAGGRALAAGGQGIIVIKYNTVGAKTIGIIAANRAGPGDRTSAVYTPPITFRTEHWAHPQGAISNLQFVDVGWGFAAVTAAATGSNVTIKRYVEYPAGAFTAVTWAASGSITVNSNASVISDKCAVTIPAGAQFWERIVITAITGAGTVIQMDNPSQATNTALGLSNGQVAGDFGNSGTVATSGAATSCFSAAAIIGDVAKNGARSFLIAGDSITYEGHGDVSSMGVNNGSGWAQRLVGPNYAWNKFGRGGQAATNIISDATTLGFLRALLGLIPNAYTDLMVLYGRNDVGTRTAVQIVSDLNLLQQQFDWSARRHIGTVVPATTSTDAWATVGNQTPDAFAAVVNALNASIRAGLPWVNGQLFEVSDAVSSARDSDLWAAPPISTVDGVHPNTLRATAIAAGFTIT